MYKNPIPRLEGKSFLVKMAFNFDEWTDISEAKKAIEKYFAENGIPDICISDITSSSEYK